MAEVYPEQSFLAMASRRPRNRDTDSESGRSKKSFSSGTVSLFSFTFEDPSCTFNPNTARGRRMFVLQMLLLPFVPILALVVQNIYAMGTALRNQQIMIGLQHTIEDTANVGRFLLEMQRERFEVSRYVFWALPNQTDGHDITLTTNMTSLDDNEEDDYYEDSWDSTRSLARGGLGAAFNSSDAILETALRWRTVKPAAKRSYLYRMFTSKIRFQTRLEDLRREILRDPVSMRSRVHWYDRVTSALLDVVARRFTVTRRGLDASQISGLLAYINYLRVMENFTTLLSLVPRYFSEGVLHPRYLRQATRCDTLLWEHVDNARLFAGPDAEYVEIGDSTASSFFIVKDAMLNSEAVSKLNTTPRAYKLVARSLLVRLRNMHLIMRQNIDVDSGEQVGYAHNQLMVAVCLMVLVLVLSPVIILVACASSTAMENFTEVLSEKTLEMRKEARKTDRLLYQMLPRQVAMQLKGGQQVLAELFLSVTIYFSEIIDFVTIASCSTPIQIVMLLNMLYKAFDNRIDRYDVYKMETIGETYMCVSGLPTRNGDRHATEIAEMSLDLLSAVHQFQVPHIRGRFVQIRIGINSGPCVAGVIGTKRPRYCLFGDTVNVASRMETTGAAMRIHISHTTHEILEPDGRYQMEFRDSIDVKGKGKMPTYWLLGKADDSRRNFGVSMEMQPEFVTQHYLDLEDDSEAIFDGDNDENRHPGPC